jgi:hypothetical protein
MSVTWSRRTQPSCMTNSAITRPGRPLRSSLLPGPCAIRPNATAVPQPSIGRARPLWGRVLLRHLTALFRLGGRGGWPRAQRVGAEPAKGRRLMADQDQASTEPTSDRVLKPVPVTPSRETERPAGRHSTWRKAPTCPETQPGRKSRHDRRDTGRKRRDRGPRAAVRPDTGAEG